MKSTTRGGPSTILASLQADLEKLADEAAANPPSSHQRRQLTGRFELFLGVLKNCFATWTRSSSPRQSSIRAIQRSLDASPHWPLWHRRGIFPGRSLHSTARVSMPSTTRAHSRPMRRSPALRPRSTWGRQARRPRTRGTLQNRPLGLACRLSKHRRNIERAISTLRIDDFECRMLVVQSGWETAAEDYLIRLFRPIWNKETKILYGLGERETVPRPERTNARSGIRFIPPACGPRQLLRTRAPRRNP